MPSSDPPAERGPILRVLIVDDNAAAAQMMGWMVEMAGMDCRVVHNVDDALRLAAQYAPHVALIDILLPGMNGFDLCRALRALPALAGTVFVAQTGWGGGDYRLRAAEAGFHHGFLKPIPFETLQSLLAEIRDGTERED